MEGVGGLADQAIDSMLLTGERVTSAAEGKRLLTREANTEALTDTIQRVVVLAVPVVRKLARGARFTRVPWVMVASSSFSIGVSVLDLSNDRLRLVRLTRKWVLSGAFGRKTSKREARALDAADRLDPAALLARWATMPPGPVRRAGVAQLVSR